jgi:hypothetical protein
MQPCEDQPNRDERPYPGLCAHDGCGAPLVSSPSKWRKGRYAVDCTRDRAHYAGVAFVERRSPRLATAPVGARKPVNGVRR